MHRWELGSRDGKSEMKRALLATVSVLALTVGATAADLSARPIPVKAPVAAARRGPGPASMSASTAAASGIGPRPTATTTTELIARPSRQPARPRRPGRLQLAGAALRAGRRSGLELGRCVRDLRLQRQSRWERNVLIEALVTGNGPRACWYHAVAHDDNMRPAASLPARLEIPLPSPSAVSPPRTRSRPAGPPAAASSTCYPELDREGGERFPPSISASRA